MTSLIITVQYKLHADLQFVFTRILLFNSAIKQKPSIYSDYKTYSQNHLQNLHQHQYRKLQKHQQLEHEHEDDSHHLETEETDREEREEVRCSEWGDHYSTTSSTSDDDEEIDRDSRSEMESRSNFGSSVHNESVVPPASAYTSVPKSKFSSKSEKSEDAASSSASWKTGHYDDYSDMRMVIRHRDLKEIVASIKEYFDKAADSGDQVSEMLETGRAQLDRSFRQLKKTVYHSSGVFSNLSSSWTSKPPLAVKYRFEPGSVGEPGGSKSLCSTLERLLAWEMKLYQEVKIATNRDSHIGYSTEEEVLPVYGTTLVTPHISDRDLELHEKSTTVSRAVRLPTEDTSYG